MLKRIYRAALGGHLYGFATESQLDAFLEEYPLVDQPAPIEVTAQQLAEWKATGSWGDDWDRNRFIGADSLLRWPLDSREPSPMTPLIFGHCWAEAPNYSDRDAYVSDLALSTIWGDAPESEVPTERIAYLGQLWDAARMSVRDICEASGLSQTQLAQRFCISLRTVQNWCGSGPSARKCPDYVRLMMLELLGLLPEL